MRVRLLPIIVGTVIDIIGTLGASMLLGILVTMLRGPEVFAQPLTGPLLVAWTVLGATFTLLGAFVAGWMAKQRQVIHGLGVAIIGGVIGLFFTSESAGSFPLVAMMVSLFAGALGGWLAGWARNEEASVPDNGATHERPAIATQRSRRLALTAGITVLAAVSLVGIGLTVPPPQQPLARLQVERVYLVPIQAAPELIDQLKDYYRERLGLDIEVLPAAQADAASYDDSRRQLIAEQVVEMLRDRYGTLTRDGRGVVIGITSSDMYPRSERWQYAFGRREAPYAIVSYARMNLSSESEALDETLVFPRLRKMVTRYIGALAFHMEFNTDRRSVMYHDIMGLDDLDRLDEDLERAGFPVASDSR